MYAPASLVSFNFSAKDAVKRTPTKSSLFLVLLLLLFCMRVAKHEVERRMFNNWYVRSLRLAVLR